MRGRKTHKIGNKYGLLTVIKLDSYINNRAMYICKCECGKELLIKGERLNRTIRGIGFGKINCGCVKREYAQGHSSKSWMGYQEIPKEYWSSCKRGAKTRNILFDITIEYAWDIFIRQNKKCTLTGVELNFGNFNRDPNATASLDRIDSSKGYTKDNIQWVHKWINLMKLDFSQDEFIKKCHEVSDFDRSKIQEKVEIFNT